MMIAFESLNSNQRRAVEWDEGPLLVLAGPGSGKTAVLTLRVARLLEADERAAVLALTFTNKAATEMRERVNRLLGRDDDRARLCTFHTFAADLLGQHGSHVGLRPGFSLMTREEDRIAVLEDVARGLRGRGIDPAGDLKNLLKVIDRLFSESYDGQGEPRSIVPAPDWLPILFRRYREALVKDSRLDFGSLLHFATRLLREKPAVARVVRLGWTHVCVDEFQDTNRAQYDLLRMITPSARHNLFVVADDDQLIYQWNGASPRRFRELAADYELRTMELPENYRCPRPIVALANRLIAHNSRRTSDRTTVSVRERSGPYWDAARTRVFESPRREADFVAKDIRERRLRPSDCAVLGRTTRLVQRTAEFLCGAGLDAVVPTRKLDFDSPAVSVLVEALRLANFRNDRVVLRRLCLAWEGLTGVAIQPDEVEAVGALAGDDFLHAWTRVVTAAGPGRHEAVLRRLREDLVDRLRFREAVDWFLEGGWDSWTDDGFTELSKEEAATWRTLHREIVAERGRDVILSTYLQHLDLSPKVAPLGPNALRCMTVHGAKGLEFEHVYLIGMAQEVFPSFHALMEGPESEQIEEERRSCFVAITRARETLTLTRAKTYFGHRKQASQFLGEMGIERVK